MKSKVQKQNGKSIRNRLIQLFMSAFVIIFIVNGFIYYNLNQAIGQVDNVYNSNINLNELTTSLENVQTQLYQYLNTKSSDALEAYYVNGQKYTELIEKLNQKPTDDSNKLMEKNIYEISMTYLKLTNQTIEAKRGRNVTKYKDGYLESKEIYEFIQTNINSLNSEAFLYNVGNYSVLRNRLSYIMIFSIVMLALVMIVAVFWAVIMTRNITRPLVELAGVATEIARGNMEVDFPIVETQDEVEAVAKACNKMIGSIRNYIETTRENYERESALKENELIMKSDLKEAQLKYLQAQINPHFLFNSLNAGAQLAMMEGAEKAYMFIQNLADFFRYNVRKTGEETTLQKEIHLIDLYIYILNVRFSGEIQYETSIDQRCLGMTMPGMILQPIVENAVNHGIKGMEGEGIIRLTIYEDSEYTYVNISDNGVGIKEEDAKKIMLGESVSEDEEGTGAGIGMKNVVSRLNRYYNATNIFYIAPARRGKGTEVILRLPKNKEQMNDENTNL